MYFSLVAGAFRAYRKSIQGSVVVVVELSHHYYCWFLLSVPLRLLPPHNLFHTPLSITYFFERIPQKEPISERVRWDAAENSDGSANENIHTSILRSKPNAY